MKKTTYTLLAFGAIAFTAASIFSSCATGNPDSPGIEYMPDMYRSPSVETNGINTWVKDSFQMGNMLPPVGTIPRGFIPFPYANTPVGDSLASLYWHNPYPHSDSIEDQGKFLFERFCIYCHGDKGDGQGKLVSSGKYSSQPPNYQTLRNDPTGNKLTDGHIYWVITYGKGNMGSHAGQVSPDERWKIIQYVERLGRGGDAWSVYQKKLAEEMAKKDTLKDQPKKPEAHPKKPMNP